MFIDISNHFNSIILSIAYAKKNPNHKPVNIMTLKNISTMKNTIRKTKPIKKFILSPHSNYISHTQHTRRNRHIRHEVWCMCKVYYCTSLIYPLILLYAKLSLSIVKSEPSDPMLLVPQFKSAYPEYHVFVLNSPEPF